MLVVPVVEAFYAEEIQKIAFYLELLTL